MSKSSRISPAQCTKWLYGPQMSAANSKYAVGGPATSKWREAYDKCSPTFAVVYGANFTPNKIRTYLTTQDGTTEILDLIVDKLNRASSIIDVLHIHSA